MPADARLGVMGQLTGVNGNSYPTHVDPKTSLERGYGLTCAGAIGALEAIGGDADSLPIGVT
ncbi:hypothetical protein QCD70_04310 [Agreia sp. PsM10]|uniref:hypothetical protein n=1 Tax=Agreia sp. PsM10 TaxID=3030533 RepID=UPI00263BCBA6|nr:hypothetical protein [Agreia sp. PsM10]MDN4639460.1 hypothetical protein [Agreia sp. PsM10]